MELLIKAVDIIPHRESAYRKGDIVEVRANSGIFGQKEGLPDFVRVKVPSLLISDVRHYMDVWRTELKFTVVASDPSQDGFRLKISNDKTDPAGTGNVTKEQVEKFITKWGGAVVSFGPNEVIFDIRVFDAFKSKGYWDVSIGGVVFNEVSYDQITGIHMVDIDYNAIGNNPTYVENFLDSKVDTVISHANKIIRVTVSRSTVKAEFEEAISSGGKRMIGRRRWYITPEQVDIIIGLGGMVTISTAQLNSSVKDRLA